MELMTMLWHISCKDLKSPMWSWSPETLYFSTGMFWPAMNCNNYRHDIASVRINPFSNFLHREKVSEKFLSLLLPVRYFLVRKGVKPESRYSANSTFLFSATLSTKVIRTVVMIDVGRCYALTTEQTTTPCVINLIPNMPNYKRWL